MMAQILGITVVLTLFCIPFLLYIIGEAYDRKALRRGSALVSLLFIVVVVYNIYGGSLRELSRYPLALSAIHQYLHAGGDPETVEFAIEQFATTYSETESSRDSLRVLRRVLREGMRTLESKLYPKNGSDLENGETDSQPTQNGLQHSNDN